MKQFDSGGYNSRCKGINNRSKVTANRSINLVFCNLDYKSTPKITPKW